MPLNPLLWQRLSAAFGEVKISNEGQVYQQADDGTPLASGEQYRVCCPYCGDTKFHLYVAYTYGQRRGRGVCRRACCFRRDCLAEPAWALDFQQRLDDPRLPLADAPLQPAASAASVPVTPTPPQLPGWCVRLDALPDDHPACAYLASRQFDHKALARTYGVGYCLQSLHAYCQGRLIIPIWQEGALAGYQARVLPGQTGPKYYSAAGMPKSRLLYNLDQARQYATIVVVEGPTDAWRVGPMAVATFGASASRWQLDCLAQLSLRAQIIWLYDADAAGRRGTEKARQRWRAPVGSLPVVWAQLPQGDPGSWPTEALRDWLAAQCPRPLDWQPQPLAQAGKVAWRRHEAHR
jgi:hypothetical protein